MKTNSQLAQLGLLIAPLLLAVLCGVGAFWAGWQLNRPPATPTAGPPSLRPTATPIDTPTSTATPTAAPTATPTPTLTPTPLPSPTVQPGAIRNMGRLITAEQDFTAWKTYDKKPDWWPFPFWHNKITLLVTGHVQAGVDLAKLRDEDFSVSGSRVQVTLPPPEIFDEPNLIESKALEDSSVNPFSMDWNQAFEAQKDLKMAILTKTKETNLLGTARQNAAMQVELLLRRMGATEVTIKWRDIYF